MKRLILSLTPFILASLSLPARLSADPIYGDGTTASGLQSVLLAPGETKFIIRDLSTGIDYPQDWPMGGAARQRVAVSSIGVDPPAGTVWTPCPSPCTVYIYRNVGRPYIWTWYTEADGTPIGNLSPNTTAYQRIKSGLTPCADGPGWLPLIESAVVTTAPLPMPRVVLGQDCYVDANSVPLISGHASTDLLYYFEVYNFNNKVLGMVDHKAAIKFNDGDWINFTNDLSTLEPIDDEKYNVRANNAAMDGSTDTLVKLGGYDQLRLYTVGIPNGTVLSGDTSLTARWRVVGDGVTTGLYIVEGFAILPKSSWCEIEYITVTSPGGVKLATAHCLAAHNLTTGNSVVVIQAPGEKRIFSTPHASIAVTSSTDFTFPPCEAAPGNSGMFSTGGSLISTCDIADGVYNLWSSRAPVVDPEVVLALQNPHMYAAKMMTQATAFTYPDPATEAAPVGGDPVIGEKIFNLGNISGATGPTHLEQLVMANNGWLDKRDHFKNARCADCHSANMPGKVQGGLDLKYFNFSNWSIISRTMSHGYSWLMGTHVAAYIRGILAPVPKQARPWNPPMQPGPGMSKGTYYRTMPFGGSATLASCIDSGNTTTCTTVPDHGYETGMWITVILDSLTGAVTTTAAPSNTVTVTSGDQFPTSYASGQQIIMFSQYFTVATRVSNTVITTVENLANDTGTWTGETNLMGVYTITVTGAKTFTFPTALVQDGTYNHSSLIVTNAHDAIAGCGGDCKAPNGINGNVLASLGDPALWTPANHIDGMNLVYSYHMPDWTFWIPVVHASDSKLGADYLNSTPYTLIQRYLNNITPGNYKSFRDQGFAGGSGLNDPGTTNPSVLKQIQRYIGTQHLDAVQDLPDRTNLFEKSGDYLAPRNIAPSQHNLHRQSVINAATSATFTLQVGYKLTGFSIPMGKNQFGTTSIPGCFPVWNVADWDLIFNVGSHKVEMWPIGIVDSLYSTYIQAANLWYVLTTGMASRQCFDAPNHPIDNGYYLGFLFASNGASTYRVQGYMSTLYPMILVVQAGAGLGGLYQYGGNQNLMDWTAVFANYWSHGPGPMRYSYFAFTDAQVVDLIKKTLAIWIATANTQSVAYWQNAISVFDGGSCTGGPNAAFENSGNLCESQQLQMILFKNLLGADSAGLTLYATHKAWLALVFPSVDWNAMEAAATDGDNTPQPSSTSGFGAAGDATATYNGTAGHTCPDNHGGTPDRYFVVRGSGGGDLAEWVAPDFLLSGGSFGTCVSGMSGTLKLHLTRGHTGTITITYGMTSDKFPNWIYSMYSPNDIPWFRPSLAHQ